MNPNWNPKVSIIIPVYNGSNYMKEAIDSALAQNYENREIIVVNDGSADNGETDRIARSYGDQIRYFCKENGGVSSALNYGIRHMTGDYVSWLSHDDVYTPDKIKHQIEALQTCDHARTVALCAHCYIDKSSEKLSKKAPKRFSDGVFDWRDVIKEIQANGAFNGCALLIPKAAFDECGEFHEGLRFSQDALMWLTIFLKQYALVYRGEEDVLSRIHGQQVTQTKRELFQRDSLTIGEILIPKLAAVSDSKYQFLYGFAARNAKYGNRAVVKKCIKIGKQTGLFHARQIGSLRMKTIYGAIRPALRNLYYRLLMKRHK